MDPKLSDALFRALESEPFAQALNMTLVELEQGYSVVEMRYKHECMDNIYNHAHEGGGFIWPD
jgi:acyl-coenzyme A thioesterase PaaI-like protein